MLKSRKVLLVGSLGFPFGSASVYRKMQISLILIGLGYKVLVVNRRGLHERKKSIAENISTLGTYNNIDFIHTSLLSYRPECFAKRNFHKIVGFIIEFITIGYNRFFLKSKVMICDSTNPSDLKYYFYLSRLFKMKFLYDYVEYIDALSNINATRIEELNKKIDHKITFYADGFFVISKYLQNHLIKLNSKCKNIIIPPMQNYNYINGLKKYESNTKYILYCGSIHYLHAIKFIIDAFNNSIAPKNKVALVLIINGNKNDLNKVTNYIEIKEYRNDIKLLNNLPYGELISYYKGAEALLLPLGNKIQDKARFPFKITEYLAARRPILTSNIGIINDYFQDQVDMVITNPDDLQSYIEMINLVVSGNLNLDAIGMNGYSKGKEFFNINDLSKYPIRHFLDDILN